MLTLAVERSTRTPGWALFSDTACILHRHDETEPSRTPGWLTDLKNALDGKGISWAAIDQYVVGLGPGSFSGTRAAIAALQGLTLPDNIPLRGINSAAALALRLLNERAKNGLHSPVAILGDARRDRIWCAVFLANPFRVWTSQNPRPVAHDASDFTLATWEELPSCIPSDAWVATPDWDRLGKPLASLFPSARVLSERAFPTAMDVAHLALMYPAAARVDPSPIYLHPAVAEKK